MRDRSARRLLVITAPVTVVAGLALGALPPWPTPSASAAASQAAPATVGCAQVIGAQARPRAGGRRLVLGVVAVPPAALPRAVRAPAGRSPQYRLKTAMVIGAAAGVVTVSVPAAWRAHVQVGWGSPARPGAVVRFSPCRGGPAWRAYAGGFWLAEASGCVSLDIAVGHRHVRVRFGVGRHC